MTSGGAAPRGDGGLLIVGASQAGVQIAASLREAGDLRPITIVGAEPHAPYQRPPLSKELLTRATETSSLALRTTEYYEASSITLLTGERVTDIERDAAGGVARTATGRELRFADLALATGARPRRLTIPGADAGGVCYLRHLDDAHRLRDHLDRAERVVVVGGGYIGLEAAAVARSEGRTVTVVEAADRLVARSVAPLVSEFYRQAHTRRGTQVLLGAQVAAFETSPGGHVRAVRLADGTTLPADLVVVGVGVVPRTELAETLGLRCEGGIVVDRFARTSDGRTVAAGDCTVVPHPVTGTGYVRLESMPNAVSQGRTAAATLLGQLRPAGDVPWFWSDQFDLKLQIAGIAEGYDELVVRGDPDTEAFAVLYYRQGSLLAVNAVNSPADYLAGRKALKDGIPLPADRARDNATPLKQLLKSHAAA